MRFCEACQSETHAHDAGPTEALTLMNFKWLFGDAFVGRSHPCGRCNSYVARLWMFLFVPIIPLARYRVIKTGPGRYVSRRLSTVPERRNGPAGTAVPDAVAPTERRVLSMPWRLAIAALTVYVILRLVWLIRTQGW